MQQHFLATSPVYLHVDKQQFFHQHLHLWFPYLTVVT